MTGKSATTLTAGAVAAVLAAGGLAGAGTTTAGWVDTATSSVTITSGTLSVDAEKYIHLPEVHSGGKFPHYWLELQFDHVFNANLRGNNLAAHLDLGAPYRPWLTVTPIINGGPEENGAELGSTEGTQQVGVALRAEGLVGALALSDYLLGEGISVTAKLAQERGGWVDSETKVLKLPQWPTGYEHVLAEIEAAEAEAAGAGDSDLATSVPTEPFLDSAPVEDGPEPEVAPEESPDSEGVREEEPAAPEAPGAEDDPAENDHAGDAPADEPSADGPAADDLDGTLDAVEPGESADDAYGRDEVPAADEGDEPEAKEPEDVEPEDEESEDDDETDDDEQDDDENDEEEVA